MKRILLSITALFVGIEFVSAADVRYDAKVWRAVQTYDVTHLSNNLEGHVRELVAMKCNFRGKDIHHMKPNWYSSSVWQPDTEHRGKFAHVVEVGRRLPRMRSAIGPRAASSGRCSCMTGSPSNS